VVDTGHLELFRWRNQDAERLQWDTDVARRHTELSCGKLLESDHLEDQERDGRITLRWILRKLIAGLGG